MGDPQLGVSEKPYNLSYTQYCALRGELHGEIFYINDASRTGIPTGTKQDWIKRNGSRCQEGFEGEARQEHRLHCGKSAGTFSQEDSN